MKSSNISHVILGVALLTSLLGTGTASAQSVGESKAEDGWVPVKRLEFTDDEIEGGVRGPEGELMVAARRAEHASLIELRKGFEPEIIKMLEDL